MTTPQEPAPGGEDATDTEDESGAPTSAEEVDVDGPLDADEGDPQLHSYPG